MFGQPFLIDSYITENVVFDKVAHPNKIYPEAPPRVSIYVGCFICGGTAIG